LQDEEIPFILIGTWTGGAFAAAIGGAGCKEQDADQRSDAD
jgi:hypothetical protein